MSTTPKIPFGYGSLKGQYEFNPDIDLTKPIFEQYERLNKPRYLDHSLSEEETEKMVDEIAADMRKALQGKDFEDSKESIKAQANSVLKSIRGKAPDVEDTRVGPSFDPQAVAAVSVDRSPLPFWKNGFEIVDGLRPDGFVYIGSKNDEIAVVSPDAESQRAISVAMKAFAALCRQGIETVELDGETIDLWDVKRDLRALLGPDEV